MRTRLQRSPFVLAVLAITLALAACAPGGGGGGGTTAPTPDTTETTTPEPTEPDALVLGVHGIVLFENGEDTGTAASREDPGAGIDLLTSLFGEPTVTEEYYGDVYEWGGVSAIDSGWLNVHFEAAELDGVVLRTSQGIQVGATREEVLALDPLDLESDASGDGVTDSFGLEPEEEPGTESLTHPGAVGTSYINAYLEDDVVKYLFAPAGDWRDV
jgi:hypothetical protein